MKKVSHGLAFSMGGAAPPPSFFGDAALAPKTAKPNKKSKTVQRGDADSWMSAPMHVSAKLSKKPKAAAQPGGDDGWMDAPMQTTSAKKRMREEANGDAPKKKKKMTAEQQQAATEPMAPFRTKSSAEPPAAAQPTPPAPSKKKQPSAVGPASPVGSGGKGADRGKGGRSPKQSAALPAEPAMPNAGAASANIATDASHVLIVSGLPPKVTERELRLHFSGCAPMQLTLLNDWSSGSPRAAACLALASAHAAKLAFAPALAHLDDGAKLNVCGAADADASATPPAMRDMVGALIAKAVAAGGNALDTPDVSHVVRHLLHAFNTHAAASAAVDDFCAVCKSGQPKNPAQLLLQTLLRHRRQSGGGVWKGRANGRPLPRAEAERLHQLLSGLDWSAMPAEGKLRGAMADQSFKLGLSTKEWAKNNGPYAPFAFKAGMGVWDAASVTKRHRELWEAASALITACDPSYPWTSVQFNKNFRGSRHRDDKDATHQVATAFGDYTGGELRVFGQDGIMDVNTRNRFVRFDGRYEHEVLPYAGTRYSVIFFALAPPFAVDASSTEEGVGSK